MPTPAQPIELDGDDIEVIRVQYIRDKYEAADPSTDPPIVALSPFNQTKNRNFVSNDDLQAITNRVWTLRATDLGTVYDEAYDRWYLTRIADGDEDAAAAAAATAFAEGRQRAAWFDYIAAEVFEMQRRDQSFMGTLAVAEGGFGKMSEALDNRIESSQESGSIRSIRMVRH